MKTKNTKQEKIAETNSLKTKLLVIGITTIGMFVLTGCQEQMTTVETKSFKVPVFVKEITFKSIPAQLASKVTLMEKCTKEIIETDQENIELSINNVNILSKYQSTSLCNLDLNKESWKDSYDGKGLPLLRVSF